MLGHSKDLSRSDIKVLSISTGHYERTKAKPLIGQAARKWGLVQWAPILIETVMSAGDRYTQARTPSTFLHTFFGPNSVPSSLSLLLCVFQELVECMLPDCHMCRIDPVLRDEWTLESTDAMPAMEEHARKLGQPPPRTQTDRQGLPPIVCGLHTVFISGSWCESCATRFPMCATSIFRC